MVFKVERLTYILNIVRLRGELKFLLIYQWSLETVPVAS